MQKNYDLKIGSISYQDTLDHFENGLLRLMNMNRTTFEKWVLNTNDSQAISLEEKLYDGFNAIRPQIHCYHTQSVDSGIYEMTGYEWCRLSDTYSLIKSIDGSIAWLAKSVNDHLQRETEAPAYEEDYFEGNPNQAGGYGKYTEQANWRLEKASRQLNDICNITGIKVGRALDIGSGYGYFRRALELAGWEHDGLEISKHACQISKSLYNYDTFNVSLNDYINVNMDNRYYDLITLWDVIEHITDPISFLQDVAMYLRPGGILAIKTPNINCPEAEIFGSHYHSLKREHLVYFTDKSLITIAAKANFIPHTITSISHLLQGFVGKEITKQWELNNRGADLIGYFMKNSDT